MTALKKQALRSKARSASAGEWIKESGDGWEAICSSDDQANGNFIIAHFEGPDAKENREFVQVANPDAMLALLDELEAAEKRISEYEQRELARKRQLVINGLCDSGETCWEIEEYMKRWDAEHPREAAVAGIGVKGE